MAGTYGVIVTREASSDLDGIYTYVARESAQNASEVTERLIDAMFSLKFLPHRYKVYRRSKGARGPVHAMPVQPFVIYYRIAEPSRTVFVLSILHGRQQRPRSFE
jgi:plasmid stabilization system protein ParE